MKKNYDVVSIFMCLVCFLALIFNGYLITMANRISKMVNINIFTAVGSYGWIAIATLGVLTILVFIKGESELKNFITGLVSSCFLGEIFFLSGLAATLFKESESPSARITWGVGTYIMIAAWYGIVIKCNQNINKQYMRFLTQFSGILIVILLFATGAMNDMSIVVEFFARQDTFFVALKDHFNISISVLISGLVVGLPLGYLCYKYSAVNSVVMTILNIVRSIPSIALILLMVTPLTFLKGIPFFEKMGISAFGFTPVFCALFLYVLFQIVNSLNGALKTVDGNHLKTARAMGMTDFMILWKVQLPLILPVLVSGLRVAIVSTFSAATLGSMVGFGGLGLFITMGSGDAVTLDLILLGAVPIIIMIFIVNLVFGLLSTWLDRRMKGIHGKNRVAISNIGE